jgi:hypothetical protein
MSVYIDRNATYNLRQVLDIVQSNFTKQAKIDSYKNADLIFQDGNNNAVFLPIQDCIGIVLLKIISDMMCINIGYYIVGALGPIATALYMSKLFIYMFELAIEINQNSDYANNILQVAIQEHKSDEYTGVELTKFINHLELNNKSIDEEGVVLSFANHEFANAQFDIISDFEIEELPAVLVGDAI